MAKSEMVFMCQTGTELRKSGLVGLVMSGYALPIAFRDTGDCEDDGFRSCWEATGDADEFFEAIRIENQNSPGLYYVKASFDVDDDVSEDGEDWEHIADMSCENIKGLLDDGVDIMADVFKEAGIGGHNTNKWSWA
jgi:hypothetical protein